MNLLCKLGIHDFRNGYLQYNLEDVRSPTVPCKACSKCGCYKYSKQYFFLYHDRTIKRDKESEIIKHADTTYWRNFVYVESSHSKDFNERFYTKLKHSIHFIESENFMYPINHRMLR